MIVDIGTGDGRAVLDAAARDRAALVIGIDAVPTTMAGSSRRADRRGPRNALFIAAGAEATTTSPLAGRADLVTVTFPWGSLLRGVLGLDEAALCGVAAIVRAGGRIEVLASVVPSDRLDGMDCLGTCAAPSIADAWRGVGLALTALRPTQPDDIAAAGSSWVRRLGPDRPVCHRT